MEDRGAKRERNARYARGIASIFGRDLSLSLSLMSNIHRAYTGLPESCMCDVRRIIGTSIGDRENREPQSVGLGAAYWSAKSRGDLRVSTRAMNSVQ